MWVVNKYVVNQPNQPIWLFKSKSTRIIYGQKIDLWKIKLHTSMNMILFYDVLICLHCSQYFIDFKLLLKEKKKKEKRNEKCNRVATKNCINKTPNLCFYCNFYLSFGIILYLFVEIYFVFFVLNHLYMAKMYSIMYITSEIHIDSNRF